MDVNHETDALQHHGVKGQKWGVRRYQRKDGSLTPLGEKRMGIKSSVDKKAVEDLKDRRAARALNIMKQRQALRQDRLNQANNRAIERAKIKLAKKKANMEETDQEANIKLQKEKLKQDKAAQKQDKFDRELNRKLAKGKFKGDKDDGKNLPDEKLYDLPDTPERQKTSSANGKKMAVAALSVAGGIAMVVAAKKFGPAIMDKLKGFNWAKAAQTAKTTASKEKDVATNKDVQDFAMKIFEEAGKYAKLNAPSNSSGQALLAAPSSESTPVSKTTTEAFSSAMAGLGDIPLYFGS